MCGSDRFLDYRICGPQAGSRTSAACTVSRWRMRPSVDTADSTPRPPLSVAYRIMRPLGAKLGDSSRAVFTPSDEARIGREAEVAELKRVAMRNGMKTLHQDSMLKVKLGLTTVEEALANVPPDLIL